MDRTIVLLGLIIATIVLAAAYVSVPNVETKTHQVDDYGRDRDHARERGR